MKNEASVSSRVIVAAAVIAVAVVVALGVYWYVHRASQPQPIAQVDAAKLPASFPSGIPFFYQTKVLQNYNAYPAGRVQATHQFVASSTADMGYLLYRQFFRTSGWTVAEEQHSSVASQKIFYASRGSEDATVIVDSILTAPDSKAPRQTVVTLNFFTPR